MTLLWSNYIRYQYKKRINTLIKSVKLSNNYSMFLFTYVYCEFIKTFSIHIKSTRKSVVLWVLWLLFSWYPMRCYELIKQLSLKNLSNILCEWPCGVSPNVVKTKIFFINLNSLLPKVILNCDCAFCWFQFFLFDHFTEKRKGIAGRKVAYNEIDLKFLIELLGISEPSINF